MEAPGPSAEQDSPLHTWLLCEELERLIHIERKAAWLLCHHFALLADRFDEDEPELQCYEDVYQLGMLRLGMTERQVRERIRVGRALRLLPQTRAAFAAGAISYAKVREVTRIAQPESEDQWLHTARAESVRSLERQVARARHADSPTGSDTRKVTRSSDGTFVDVQLRLPAATWSLVLRAMEAARQKSQVSLSDAEALEAVARCALAPRAAAPAANEEADLDFLDNLASRSSEDTPAGEDQAREENDPADPTGSTATAVPEATRPGHCGADEESPDPPDEMTRPGRDDVLVSAPGRMPLSEDCIDAARMIVPAVESGEATDTEALSQLTRLSATRLSVTILELTLAGILAQTHKGLVLTPWARRNRFRAVDGKLRH